MIFAACSAWSHATGFECGRSADGSSLLYTSISRRGGCAATAPPDPPSRTMPRCVSRGKWTNSWLFDRLTNGDPQYRSSPRALRIPRRRALAAGDTSESVDRRRKACRDKRLRRGRNGPSRRGRTGRIGLCVGRYPASSVKSLTGFPTGLQTECRRWCRGQRNRPARRRARATGSGWRWAAFGSNPHSGKMPWRWPGC
jgi:hypothetical protein